MKQLQKIVGLLGLILLSVGCQHQKVKQHRVANQYRIEAPDFLEPTTLLNSDASLQLHNEAEAFFTVVIDEPKEDFDEMMATLGNQYESNFSGYAHLITDNLRLMVDHCELTPLQEVVIHAKKAKLFTVEGEVDSDKMVYLLGFIEGKKHYYQIVSWTNAPQKETHLKAMKQIVYSFKEVVK